MHDDSPGREAAPDDPFERARRAQDRAIARRRTRGKTRPRPGSPAPWLGSPTQRQGRAAEMLAARYLEAQGLRLLARNLSCKAGEIDLAALDGSVLVFVEVRARRDAAFGGAAASVNRGKQTRLLRAARHFLPLLVGRHLGGRVPACRFDVVSVEAGAIAWIPNAFME
ncbi:YraN family protein [Castellaniella sp. GW247-6E4]|uniref:YraN family protein n=1 Tax=Castellaniella sp. GW247-6E4 TaxID=3140380 RepID=UPI00331496F1